MGICIVMPTHLLHLPSELIAHITLILTWLSDNFSVLCTLKFSGFFCDIVLSGSCCVVFVFCRSAAQVELIGVVESYEMYLNELEVITRKERQQFDLVRNGDIVSCNIS